MMVPALPYHVKHYNSLPELGLAKYQFEAARVSEILFTEIGMAFVIHHVESTLGLILLHNHFLLEPDETLVNISSGSSAVGHGEQRQGAHQRRCQRLVLYRERRRAI